MGKKFWLIVLSFAMVVCSMVGCTDPPPASTPAPTATYQHILQIDGTIYECQDYWISPSGKKIRLYDCRNYEDTVTLGEFKELIFLDELPDDE